MRGRLIGLGACAIAAATCMFFANAEHEAANREPPHLDNPYNQPLNKFSNPFGDQAEYQEYLKQAAAEKAVRDEENSLYIQYEHDRKGHLENRDIFVAIFVLLILGIIALCIPWRRIHQFLGHSVDTASEGMGKAIRKTGNAISGVLPDRVGTPIIGRDGLASYSSADELIKWKRLLDEGVVTEKEYNDAINKILRRV